MDVVVVVDSVDVEVVEDSEAVVVEEEEGEGLIRALLRGLCLWEMSATHARRISW